MLFYHLCKGFCDYKDRDVHGIGIIGEKTAVSVSVLGEKFSFIRTYWVLHALVNSGSYQYTFSIQDMDFQNTKLLKRIY